MFIVNSASSLQKVIDELRLEFEKNKFFKVGIKTRFTRTEIQNNLWAEIYWRAAQSYGFEYGSSETEYAAAGVRAECKLLLGVPILLRENLEFSEAWNAFFLDKTHEQQLKYMLPNPLFGKDGFPVTRLFDKRQGIEYTNCLIQYFLNVGLDFTGLVKDWWQ